MQNTMTVGDALNWAVSTHEKSYPQSKVYSANVQIGSYGYLIEIRASHFSRELTYAVSFSCSAAGREDFAREIVEAGA